MRKINLENYPVNNGGTEIPYDVSGTMVTCMMHPQLQLTGKELLERHEIGKKILDANGSVLLEEDEYKKLLHSFETVKGFSKNDTELCSRVFNAEIVQVTEIQS